MTQPQANSQQKNAAQNNVHAAETPLAGAPATHASANAGAKKTRRRRSASKSSLPGKRRFLFLVLSVAGSLLAIVLFTFLALRWHFFTLAEARREGNLLPAIHLAARHNNLEPELVRAVIWKESRFNPNSVGTKGEIGLMQITDGAVKDWARVNHRPLPARDELFAPDYNLLIGCWYLAHCRKHWDGYASQDLLLLAEYNAGRTKVLKDWAPENPQTIVPLDQISYPSTRNYVQQILQQRGKYQKERHAVAIDK